jgi:serine/threonine-protein kinase HipA
VNGVTVFLHDAEVGTLLRSAGQYIFSFGEAYAADPDRPTLSLSYKSTRGGLLTAVRGSPRLPPFFANLLPEGHLRGYLAQRAGVDGRDELGLLVALGRDLPGAVRLEPFGDAAAYQADPPLSAAGPDRPLRFSLAGVQLKFLSIQEPRGGLAIPADGAGGAWILKLPSTHLPAVPENEFVMLCLARAIGITVPESRLVAVSDVHGLPAEAAELPGPALAVRRFDRGGDGRRIHMEDFAQVFRKFPDDKYEGHSYANIAQVLASEGDTAGTAQFVRRVVFSLLVHNTDMHLKNWSVLYEDGRTPRLSPAYDFVCTRPYILDHELGLSFGGSKDITRIDPDRIRRFADAAGLAVSAVAREVEDTVQRTVSAWETLPEKSLLPDTMHHGVDQHLRQAAASTLHLLTNARGRSCRSR